MYFSCQIPCVFFPSAFNLSGETDALSCMLIAETEQAGEVQVPQNFSAVARNEVLKVFWIRYCSFWKCSWKVPCEVFISGSQIALVTDQILNPFTHGCVAFCVHQWKVQRKHEMWIREIWESIFVDETDEEDRTTPPSYTYQLSLSLDVAPQRAPRRLPKQLEVSLPLQGSLRWIGELADLGGGIIAAVAEGSKGKSCSFSVVGPPRSSVGASCNSCLTPRVSCFALLYWGFSLNRWVLLPRNYLQ